MGLLGNTTIQDKQAPTGQHATGEQGIIVEGLLVLIALLFFAWPIIPLIFALKAGGKAKQLERMLEQLKGQLAESEQKLGKLQQRVLTLEHSPRTNAALSSVALPEDAIPPRDPVNVPASASAPVAPVTDSTFPITPEADANPAVLIPALIPAENSSRGAGTSSQAGATPASPPVTPNRIAEIEARIALAATAAPQTRTTTPPGTPAQAPVRRAPTPPPPDPAWLVAAKQWLFGGNLVAKMGLLILFIGVSFLLKFAAAHVSVPIEIRLTGVMLADIALLLWGWRIRVSRPGIALPVQGAALAIMMMVTFAAFRIYALIPSGLAFALLFALTGFTCLLAVLQNALWLAIFGIIGGFAAPILTSTGNGSHIGLFSYYALLNTGIFAIARFRSWRSLNLLGFLFTFVIGTAWGMLKYEPQHYQSAQGFLILFFLFYVAIALVYAARQAPQLKSYVDGTLVFGTPMLAFGLQYGLVKSFEFGLAYSSLALGLFYITLALVLWKKRGGTLRLLVEAFLALGIIFGTLAIPFALDGRWTSGAWALEGAGILWIGLRQKQKLVWAFGLLVQLGAGLSFLLSVSGLDGETAAKSNLWLGFLLLAATAFVVASRFRAENARLDQALEPAERAAHVWFERLATLFLAGASIWLVAGAWTEIFLHTHGATQATLVVISALITATVLALLAKKLAWPVAQKFAMVLQLITGLVLLLLSLANLKWPDPGVSRNLFDGPFLGALLIGIAALFSAHVFRKQASADGSKDADRNVNRDDKPGRTTPAASQTAGMLLAWSGFWWFSHILHALAGWMGALYASGETPLPRLDLVLDAYALLLAITGPLWLVAARRWQWPQLRWLAVPVWMMLALHSANMLEQLIGGYRLPPAENWAAWLALWLASEQILRGWQWSGSDHPDSVAAIPPFWLKALHLVRVAAPWLMLWPVGSYWMRHWLAAGNAAQQALLEQADWTTSASWARYVPVWLMMAATAWLMRCTQRESWPVAPLTHWYRTRLLPLACGWPVFLVAIWNISQDGAMAPLPYLPLLNPLDLTTGFALLQTLYCYRQLATPDSTGKVSVPLVALLPLYGWFNLMLLRTCSHWLDIPYAFDPLFMSGTVQVMLSLVWSVTALILMRLGTRSQQLQLWLWGAGLLAVVVAKLFLVDQANHGGVERIIAFVGVGVLMLVIGYLAPLPGKTPVNRPERDKDQDIPQDITQDTNPKDNDGNPPEAA